MPTLAYRAPLSLSSTLGSLEGCRHKTRAVPDPLPGQAKLAEVQRTTVQSLGARDTKEPKRSCPKEPRFAAAAAVKPHQSWADPASIPTAEHIEAERIPEQEAARSDKH